MPPFPIQEHETSDTYVVTSCAYDLSTIQMIIEQQILSGQRAFERTSKGWRIEGIIPGSYGSAYGDGIYFDSERGFVVPFSGTGRFDDIVWYHINKVIDLLLPEADISLVIDKDADPVIADLIFSAFQRAKESYLSDRLGNA